MKNRKNEINRTQINDVEKKEQRKKNRIMIQLSHISFHEIMCVFIVFIHKICAVLSIL